VGSNIHKVCHLLICRAGAINWHRMTACHRHGTQGVSSTWDGFWIAASVNKEVSVAVLSVIMRVGLLQVRFTGHMDIPCSFRRLVGLLPLTSSASGNEYQRQGCPIRTFKSGLCVGALLLAQYVDRLPLSPCHLRCAAPHCEPPVLKQTS